MGRTRHVSFYSAHRIVKVIFDRIEPLKPFGFLIGDNQPEIGKVIFNLKPQQKK
jgi:hypothetical protein